MKDSPDRFSVRKCYAEDFRQLAESLGVDNKNIFFMAMALGFLNNAREELDVKEGLFLMQVINDEEKALMSAIAFSEAKGNIGVLLNTKTIYLIAEEYASGGLKYLKKDVQQEQFGNYSKRLEHQVLQQFSTLTNQE